MFLILYCWLKTSVLTDFTQNPILSNVVVGVEVPVIVSLPTRRIYRPVLTKIYSLMLIYFYNLLLLCIGVAWVKILRGPNSGAARILFRGDIQQKKVL